MEREVPKNIEAEQSVLCAMMLDRQATMLVLEFLKQDDFYVEADKVIFGIMQELYSSKENIDFNTVLKALKEKDLLKKVGGLEYIMGLTTKVYTSANVQYHAKIVKEKSIHRKMIKVGMELSHIGYDAIEFDELAVKKAENLVMDLAHEQNDKTFTVIHDTIVDYTTKLLARTENKKPFLGIPTGFTYLDKLTSGLQASDFIILAARPSMGKTAFALNVAQNIAIRSHNLMGKEAGYNVAIFSLEMSKEQLVTRMICSEAQISSQKLRNHELSYEEWDRFFIACNTISKAKIFIDDTAGISVTEVRSKARRLKAEQGLDIIIIDYLQLMKSSSRVKDSMQRQQEVSLISRSLKALARELSVPVIALSQLSRSVEAREIKRPVLSDLRESGSLEQDADLVAFLYRPKYYDKSKEDSISELILAKHRNGEIDTVYLEFEEDITKSKDCTSTIN